MSEVHDASIHLIITSPPYWQLKDYGNQPQIGFNDSYEEYVNNLNLVWIESHRVLYPGCRLCVNIGDQFARSVYYGRYKVIPIRTEIIKFCETIGFDYMGAIIWQKVTTTNTTGGASVMGSYPFPRNGILKLDYEFILIFKKLGKPPKVSTEIKEASGMTHEEWNNYFTGHWNFPGERQSKHLAMFPVELPQRLIKMFSFVGETVLDPFLGSGTTTLAAMRNNRNSVGFEIMGDFLPIITQKLGIDQRDVFSESDVQIITRESKNLDFSKDIEQLPYRFSDPIRFDKKIDPRKMKFGSRIDKHSSAEREEYYQVMRVDSPDLLTLNGNLKVRLIGVTIKETHADAAIRFIQNMTKGQRVYLKHDSVKFDSDNNLLCYIYLKNKTFLNAHLIKKGLVDVDIEADYRQKTRFLKYSEDR